MNKLSNLSVLALVAIAAAGPAFAATPKFTNGAPGTAMSVDDFASQLGSFNAKDVTDLLDAKSVTVYNYNTAWTDKAGKAVNLLTDDSQSIGLLREARLRRDNARTRDLGFALAASAAHRPKRQGGPDQPDRGEQIGQQVENLFFAQAVQQAGRHEGKR